MDYIKLTSENLDREHICCAISSNKDPQVLSKKQWLRERLEEGLVFLKGDIRGKCFIEYIPAEYAWVPIEAAGYMHINCFWVSGACKGHGYSNELLAACMEDAKAVAALVEARFPHLNGKVEINSIGTTIGSHTGPGTVALFFFGAPRKG